MVWDSLLQSFRIGSSASGRVLEHIHTLIEACRLEHDRLAWLGLDCLLVEDDLELWGIYLVGAWVPTTKRVSRGGACGFSVGGQFVSREVELTP